ncbi:MAG TPA: ABC transporter permease [Candidatus Dormibacteraeota bacterium]|nr:ABC transporter permease [Candidatus Dormibacteraeota bacterium]
MLAYVRFEVVRVLRNVRFLVFTVVVPALLYLLFDGIYGDGRVGEVAVGVYLLVAMAAYGAIGAALSVNGSALATERASGWLRQLRVTPLSDRAWLVARLALALVAVAPGVLAVSLCAAVVGHVGLDPARWLALGGLLLLGSLPFAFLGMLVGLLLDAQSAQPAQVLLLMLLSFGGGLFFPVSVFPSGIRPIAESLPSYHLLVLGQEVVAGRPLSLDQLAGLAGSIVLLGALALVAWRRTDRAGAREARPEPGSA